MSELDWSAENEAERLDAMARDASSLYWVGSDHLVDQLVTSHCSGVDDEEHRVLADKVKDAARMCLPTFQRACTWKSYLTTITRNKWTDYLRQKGRKPAIEWLTDDHNARADTLDLESRCITRDELQHVLRLLKQFVATRQDRERDGRIILALLESLSNDEIAARLHISKQTVANVLFAMRKYLRERHPRDGADGSGKPPDSPGSVGPMLSPEKGE